MIRSSILISVIISVAALNLKADKPTVYAVSNAHLDTQWNWDVQTTIKDYIKKTLDQNLFLLDRYPDYIFNFEGGIKYSWMKEYYPDRYERMRDYVKKGRWHIAGSSWDANDVNVPSVESLIRNIMLGQNFYRKEFGTESTDIFLPDCFGFGYTLPTVANHCGLIGFSSQKLGWRQKPFYGKERYPFAIGLWKGVDGSRIMMAHGYDYNRKWNDKNLDDNSKVANLAKDNGLGKVFHYYGTGDIGGAPTVGSVDAITKASKRDGEIQVISAESDRLFKDYLPYQDHPELPEFDGELLMDVHGTGCYTSQAAMKLYNRQNELLGDAAERGALTASMFTGHRYPAESLTESWKRFIFHQFHDDLTGTSIPRAYEFSWNDELLSLKQFSDILTDAAAAVAANLDTETSGIPVLLFNPLGYENTEVIILELYADAQPKNSIVKDHDGRMVNSQILGYSDGKVRIAVEATVPAVGYAVYDVILEGSAEAPSHKAAEELENSRYALKFDKNGDIVSLIDKIADREIVKEGKAIRLAMFTDNPSYNWPAWEIMKSTIDAEPESIGKDVEISLVEDGPLLKTVKISKRHGDSSFTQYIRLYEGELADRIDIMNSVDWKSLNSLLKAEFPLTVASETATYDLGLGVAVRGNNTEIAYEVPAQQWADLSDDNYGLTIINDSRYGWDKPDDNTLRLTLLHTPGTKKGYRYQDRQDQGYHEFSYSLIPHTGALDRSAAVRMGEKLNQKIKAFAVPKSSGKGRSLSLASSNSESISIKALKGAEDGDGVVMRVYETAGQNSEGEITFSAPIRKVMVANGTEKIIEEIPFSDNKIKVNLMPNGLATYRIYFDIPEQNDIKTCRLSLPYNTTAITWNGYPQAGRLSGGYSFAAEILPDTVNVSEVEFNICKDPYNNATVCRGETLQIPDGEWKRIHLLMAADSEEQDIKASIGIGNEEYEITVPSYTGFIGQWKHDGHTDGYLKPQRVAYTGTHRHSQEGDEPYEFSYMFHYALDLPDGVKSISLPEDSRIVLFAATVSNGDNDPVSPAWPLFKTSNKEGTEIKEAHYENLLKPEMIVSCTGFVKDKERPEFLVDGDDNTKWCDVSGNPPEITFDLSEVKEIKGWKILNAGEENPSYITSSCLLLGRESKDEDWHTIDMISANKRNLVNRKLSSPQKARYIGSM